MSDCQPGLGDLNQEPYTPTKVYHVYPVYPNREWASRWGAKYMFSVCRISLSIYEKLSFGTSAGEPTWACRSVPHTGDTIQTHVHMCMYTYAYSRRLGPDFGQNDVPS
jgi:hypothetical protein